MHASVPTPSQTSAPQADPWLGAVLEEKWRVERCLGVGGMASVYLARHQLNGRHVAIKILHPELCRSEEVLSRFYQEAYAANTVNHPGTVPVLDDGTTPTGAPFLIMERLQGESVEQRWQRLGGRLAIGDVLSLTEALLEILMAAHRNGVIHRDIKLENLFLTPDGQLKLLDFGIAHLDQGGSIHATRTGETMGTPGFMPPEQARGRWSDVDERSDLWSVGAVMYALISGHYSHEAETQNEVLLATMTRPVRNLREVAPDVDPRVAAVVDRALAFERSERFSRASEMLAAVQQVRVGLTDSVLSAAAVAGPTLLTASSSRPVVLGETGQPSSRGGGKSVWLLASSLALLSAVGAALLLSRSSDPGAEGESQAATRSSTVTEASNTEPRLQAAPAPTEGAGDSGADSRDASDDSRSLDRPADAEASSNLDAQNASQAPTGRGPEPTPAELGADGVTPTKTSPPGPPQQSTSATRRPSEGTNGGERDPVPVDSTSGPEDSGGPDGSSPREGRDASASSGEGNSPAGAGPDRPSSGEPDQGEPAPSRENFDPLSLRN